LVDRQRRASAIDVAAGVDRSFCSCEVPPAVGRRQVGRLRPSPSRIESSATDGRPAGSIHQRQACPLRTGGFAIGAAWMKSRPSCASASHHATAPSGREFASFGCLARGLRGTAQPRWGQNVARSKPPRSGRFPTAYSTTSSDFAVASGDCPWLRAHARLLLRFRTPQCSSSFPA
jgi:hypothetical protein